MKQCEICEKSFKYLEEHHIHSVSLGGSNKSWNKAKLCPSCHTLIHFGDIICEGRFGNGKGTVLVWRKKGEESITGFDDPPVFLYNNQYRRYLCLMGDHYENYEINVEINY